MAISVYYYKDEPTAPHRTFLCDSDADIDNLPTQTKKTADYPNGTPTGSTALVVTSDGVSVWILNNIGNWIKI
ncbi:MAG: hypothetical protein Q4C12_00170 [Clostridia bacterium]|nr:hypothetical protein [Clostridia bacterium]